MTDIYQYLSKGSHAFLQVVFLYRFDVPTKDGPQIHHVPTPTTNGWPTTIVPSSCRASADLYSSPYRLTSAFVMVIKFYPLHST